MKISTNKQELKQLNACEDGYKKFVKAHGGKDTKLSECVDSNGWDDVWWLISNTYSQFSEEQKHDLRVFGCNAALINIEKIKPYCSDNEYKIITDYLKNPTESAAWSAAESAESAWSAAESAARSAAWSAWSAWSARSAAWSAWSAWSARSAAWSAWSAWSARSAAWSAWSAWSARSAAWSAAMERFTQELKKLFLKWESSEQ